jgi:hypothetical protein
MNMGCLHSLAPADEELLSFALDGEPLSEPKRAHLDQCDTCQQRLARYKHVNSTLLAQVYRRLCPSGAQLSFYCSDLLPASEKTRIAAHILECPLCTAEVDTTRHFMEQVRIDDIAPSFVLAGGPGRALRRVFGQLVHQPSQLVLRDGGANFSEKKAWPRQYRAVSVDLSLHLSLASNGELMLLGILSSVDNAEHVDAYMGAQAVLYPAVPGQPIGEQAVPSCSSSVDDLGNIVFNPVTPGDYTLVVHLLEQEVIIENINVERS